jgi:hypothetical protein
MSRSLILLNHAPDTFHNLLAVWLVRRNVEHTVANSPDRVQGKKPGIAKRFIQICEIDSALYSRVGRPKCNGNSAFDVKPLFNQPPSFTTKRPTDPRKRTKW